MKRILIPIEVVGDHPHPSGVVQRVDERAMQSFLSQSIPAEGLQLDFDHYSDLTNEERTLVESLGIQLPSKAAGWIKSFVRKVENGIDCLFGEVDLTDEGVQAIESKSYISTSPVHPRSTMEYLGNGIVRPMTISKVALTNEPNIKALGSIILNRPAYDLANATRADGMLGPGQPIESLAIFASSKTNQTRSKMKSKIAGLLKLDANAADEVIVAGVSDLCNRAADAKTGLDAEIAKVTELKNRAETAEAKLAELEAAKVKAETDAKVTAELAKYPGLANRAEAEQMLRADFDKGAAFLASLKIQSKVPGKNPGTEDLANRGQEGEPTGYDRVAKSFKKS